MRAAQSNPSDELLIEAGRRCGFLSHTVESLRSLYRGGGDPAFTALCDYIAETNTRMRSDVLEPHEVRAVFNALAKVGIKPTGGANG